MSNGASSGAGQHPGTAQLLVVLLGFAWGLMWIATAFALQDIKPWTLRMAGIGCGATTLFIAARIAGFDLYVPPRERVHVMIGGFFNVAAFHIFSAFAQLNGATSRAVIITYTMPIWAAALSVLMLREKLGRVRLIALALCVAGIGILVWPLFRQGLPVFVFYSLAAAIGWAFATVYMKWQRVTVPPLANAAWQLLFGFGFLLTGTLVFEGVPRLWPISTASIIALIYIGIFGVGLAHFLWWSIVGKLSPVTASIGALLVPVVGVTTSIVFLGERPTAPDIVGFVLIFSAAACVLLGPAFKSIISKE
jgi:drug/metabolite transporter (DMT)-like permease